MTIYILQVNAAHAQEEGRSVLLYHKAFVDEAKAKAELPAFTQSVIAATIPRLGGSKSEELRTYCDVRGYVGTLELVE